MTQYPLELPTLPGPWLQVQAVRRGAAVRLVVAVRLAGAEAQAQQPLQAQARGVSLQIRPIKPAARPERLPERNAGGRQQMPSSRVSRVGSFACLPSTPRRSFLRRESSMVTSSDRRTNSQLRLCRFGGAAEILHGLLRSTSKSAAGSSCLSARVPRLYQI